MPSKLYLAFIVVVALVAAMWSVQAQMTPEEELEFLRAKVKEFYPRMPHEKAEAFAQALLKVAQEEAFLPLETAHAYKARTNVSALANFDCQVYGPSDQVPESAKQLRPADIKVLAALGDSLTAGFGAKAATIFTLFNDYRGVSYAIGGDGSVDKVVTLGSILLKYNAKIKGLSTGKGDINSAGANLNLAVTGAIVQDMVDQAKSFIARVKTVASDEDWKMVTILIGHNNLCDFCEDADANGPETFGRLLEESIDILYDQVPRLFVNLLSPIDVTALYPASQGFCSLLHSYECSCAVNKDANVREAVSKAHDGYYAELQRIVGLDKYKGRPDFAVVLQPFLQNTEIPYKSDGKSPDTSYLAPDCFHFSEKAHQAAAVGLWNNIIEEDKQTSWVPGEAIKCPANDAYIFAH